MAQSSAKRTAKDNAQLLQILRYGFLLVQLVHVALRFGLNHSTATGWHVVGYAVNTVGSWWVYRQLSGMPDLSQAGLTQ